MYKLVAIVAMVFLCTNISFSQPFEDQSYYLVDSIVLAEISEDDRAVLADYLEQYHEEKNDVKKLEILEEIIDAIWDDNLWPRYNFFLREKAVQLYHEEEDKELKNKYKHFEGVTYGNSGYAFDMVGLYEEAEIEYKKALRLFEEAESTGGIGRMYGSLGLLKDKDGDKIASLEYYEKALALVKAAHDTDGIIYNYNNLASTHNEINNHERALLYYNQSLELAKTSNNLYGEAYAFAGLGGVYYKMNELNKALNNALVAKDIFEKIGATEHLGRAYVLLARIADEEHRLEDGKKHFEKALELGMEHGNIEHILSSWNGLRDIALGLNNGEEALKWARKSYQLSKKLEEQNSIFFASEGLSRAYEKIGQADSSLKYAREFIYLMKIQLGEETQKALYQQEAKYDYEQQKAIDDLKHEQELALERSEKQKNRIAFIGASVIVLLLVIGAFLGYKQLRVIRAQKQQLTNALNQLEESKKSELIASNLKVLQSQMNPHFIFNALNSVQDLVLLQDIRNSNKYLGKFSDLIRKILQSSREQYISLQDELETLQLYLDLEQLRFGDDFEALLTHDIPEAKRESLKVPAMFIQPFAENAIKHGLFHKKGHKKLHIDFKLEANKNVVCTIVDNGVGQQAAAEQRQKNKQLHIGFSTQAIEERIFLLNQTLKEKVSITKRDLFVNNEPAGLEVVIKFPFITT